MENMLAYVEPDKGGHYLVAARYNLKGKFRYIERLPTRDMADLFVKQLSEDDTLRHSCLRETVDWDFIENKPLPVARARAQKQAEIEFFFD
jgi:hypothetical protein